LKYPSYRRLDVHYKFEHNHSDCQTILFVDKRILFKPTPHNANFIMFDYDTIDIEQMIDKITVEAIKSMTCGCMYLKPENKET